MSGHSSSSSRSYKKYSKQEIMDIYDYAMNHKEWWTVDDGYDNSEELQLVLDTLYNSNGSNYSAQYMESSTTTRLIAVCNVCTKNLSSKDPLTSHHNGKSHRKAVIQQQSTTLYERPLVFRNLNFTQGIFKEGSLEEKIDHCDKIVLGMQFIYKWIVYEPVEEYLYKCDMCKTDDLREEDMFNHITGARHGLKYLKLKFNYPYNLSEEEYVYESRKVMEREGRINFNIPDFSKQLSEGRSKNLLPEDISAIQINETESGEDTGSASTTTDVNDNKVTIATQTDLELFANQYAFHELYAFEDPSIYETIIGETANDPQKQELFIYSLGVLGYKLGRYWINRKSVPEGFDQPTFEKYQKYAKKLTELSNKLKPIQNNSNSK